MITTAPFGSLSFKMVARGFVKLHRLIAAGGGDSLEADAVRDSMEPHSKILTGVERERARWLSEDLYSISDPPDPGTPKEINPQAQQKLTEAVEARQNSEWDRALLLLRRWQKYISPALLSYVRGSIWLESGHPHVATEFYRHASECDPTNANYRAYYLYALTKSDPDAASVEARQILANDGAFAPIVVARAGGVSFYATRTATDGSANVYRDLIPVLERTVKRFEPDMDTPSREAHAMSVMLLGFCHEFLGNAGAAIEYHSLGLQLNPHNDALLVARGILQYGTTPRAVTDLEGAARLGSPLIWPYLFLAHHYLTTSRFDECRLTCEAGLRTTGSDMAKSLLEDWKATAQAELRFPPELVMVAFDAAVRLDPSNEYAVQNRAAYEASLRSPQAGPRFAWVRKSATEVRQFGIAESRGELMAA